MSIRNTFELHKLYKHESGFYLLLVVTMETMSSLLKNGNEINCISEWLELVHLVSILQNLMCLKIVEYKILVQVLDKLI